MTHPKTPRPVHLNNPGGLASYYNVEYNDGYVNGMAQYRSMTDGQKALLTAVWRIYKNLDRRTLRDFIPAFFPLSKYDYLFTLQALQARGTRAAPWGEHDDLMLTNVVRATELAQRIALVQNGAMPTTWLYKPLWMSPIRLLELADELGFWS